MTLTASPSIDPRALWRAPSWFDFTDEALPRRVHRTDAQPHDEARPLFTPIISWASASGAPAMPFPFRQRTSRNRNDAMTVRIEPSLSFDVQH